MKKLGLIVTFAALVLACNNLSQEKETILSSTVTNEESDTLFKEILFPLTVDTNLLFKIETMDSLPCGEIKTLAKNLSNDTLTKSVIYVLSEYFKIDSIKRAGKYQEFIDSLGIGQTQNVTAHSIGKAKLADSSIIYVWGLHYDSYPACPSTTSNTIFISVKHNGQIVETFCAGNVFWFADPPSVAMQWTKAIIKDKEFPIDITLSADDIDDSLPPEITHASFGRAGFKH